MKKIFPFFLLVLLLASCQKDPDMSKLDNDFLVFTNHDKDAKFESFTTFYIPDSVLVIGTSEKPQFWTANEADDIITTLVNNMESRGFKRTLDKDNADLGLQVSYVQSTQYFADYNDGYNYPYWWWNYPGYWSPGYWGPGWGNWYYPYPVVYSYSVGSLLTELVDLDAPAASKADAKLPVLWTAYMSGLLSGSDKFDTQLAVRAIEQAFVNFLFDRDFWAKQPNKYPPGYYWFSTRIRNHIFIGERITLKLNPNSSWHKSISFFYELSTCDLYIINAIGNSYLKPKDYLSLSFGVKLQIL